MKVKDSRPLATRRAEARAAEFSCYTTGNRIGEARAAARYVALSDAAARAGGILYYWNRAVSEFREAYPPGTSPRDTAAFSRLSESVQAAAVEALLQLRAIPPAAFVAAPYGVANGA